MKKDFAQMLGEVGIAVALFLILDMATNWRISEWLENYVKS